VVDNHTLTIDELDEDRKYATGYLEGRVDPSGLDLDLKPASEPDDTERLQIDVPELPLFSQKLAKISHLLSFLTDIPIRNAHRVFDTLEPESTDDERLLKKFGTRDVAVRLDNLVGIRTFVLGELLDGHICELSKKESGLALYAQALLMNQASGRFRELWRVLESAFGKKDDDLLKCLIEFKATQELEFTARELKDLLILRGRVSHAESRKGLEEIARVNGKARDRIPRLKSLVERVILTKKTWGSMGLGAKSLAPLAGYVKKRDSVVIIKRTQERGGAS
jgi:hypothetical protein